MKSLPLLLCSKKNPTAGGLGPLCSQFLCFLQRIDPSPSVLSLMIFAPSYNQGSVSSADGKPALPLRLQGAALQCRQGGQCGGTVRQLPASIE